MRKIPTIFERDWDGDRSRVLPIPTPGCEWVFAGEGVATRKWDGTSCKFDEYGQLWKRHEVREGKETPLGFVEEDDDLETGKKVGWIPVGEEPDSKWHREALSLLGSQPPPGTYELVGPKIQGNPEGFTEHHFVAHGVSSRYVVSEEIPRTYEGLKKFLEAAPIEGIVFHHPDGRAAKIKKRDFGFKR